MSRITALHASLEQQLSTREQLNAVNKAIDQLTIAHANDLRKGERSWPEQLAEAHQAINQASATAVPDTLAQQLRIELAACDSLHRQTISLQGNPEAAEMADAVFGLMVNRAHKHVEVSIKELQEQGLGQATTRLASTWNHVHLLLALASLFALVCALLAGYVSRLLVRANERSTLLARTGEELERTNRSLRETMLSAEEKSVMLKEIHHRVKNNLQIVRSLIRFQTDKVQEPQTLELFNECVNRVGAMALVHEQTYMSKDLANINVANYLNSLIRDLVSAYNISLDLHMDVRIEVETLGVDTLTPLGLLINEVVSNSFKHAFRNRTKGTLILHMNGSEEEGLVIRVGDDGVGLPDTVEWQNPNSLGMDLIHTLAGQLNASVDMLPGPGVVYQLITTPQEQVRRQAS